jgi:hypothetical protein
MLSDIRSEGDPGYDPQLTVFLEIFPEFSRISVQKFNSRTFFLGRKN